MILLCCLYIRVFPLFFLMPGRIFMKLYMYSIVSQPISTSSFVNPSNFLQRGETAHMVCGPLFLPVPSDTAICGIRIDRGNLSTLRKPDPVPLCPPQIPHDLTFVRTQAATAGNRRLTALTTAWLFPRISLYICVWIHPSLLH
jgi:hypothetical protein